MSTTFDRLVCNSGFEFTQFNGLSLNCISSFGGAHTTDTILSTSYCGLTDSRCAQHYEDNGNNEEQVKVIEKRIFGEKLPTVGCNICGYCQGCYAVWLNGEWCPVSSVLTSEDKDRFHNIKTVDLPVERLVLFLLSEIYNNNEINKSQGESPFTKFSQFECAKLVWKLGHAAGFYTVKEKGSQISSKSAYEILSMPLVDTLFIRSNHRRQGLATAMIDDIVKTYPDEDIGFSQPISKSLEKVLYKYLKNHARLREKMWACSYTGEEGYRENLWFDLCNKL